jgi:hypothetical protein
MKRRIAAALWLSVGVLFGSWAASAPAISGEQDVVVQGKALRDLRTDVKKAERRFRSLYDELNQDVQQQVSCQDDAATGTRFKKRTCTTRAAANATAQAAQDYVATADLDTAVATQTSRTIESDQAAPASPSASVPERYVATLAGVDLGGQGNAYQRNLEKLMRESPELRKRFEEYVQARARLDAAESKVSEQK